MSPSTPRPPDSRQRKKPELSPPLANNLFADAHSDHPSHQFYDQEHRYPIIPDN